MFQPATRRQARLHLALIGPAGSGKTYTALRLASALAGEGGRIALIDTERSSACAYASDFRFDVAALEDHHPRTYVDAIRAADTAGYEVLIIDSLSHAWMGRSGALELVDRAARRSRSGSSFAAWRDVTPLHNQLLDTMLSARCHVIATLRAKMAYTQEKDEKGRTRIRKVGMQPIQRDGLEYEFDIVGDLDLDHNLSITKTRCSKLSGALIHRPGEELARVLGEWLSPPGALPLADPRADWDRAVAEAGFEPDQVLHFFRARGRGDPSTWPSSRRRAALDWLRSEAGAVALRDYLAAAA